jgi:hypothetical protein
MQMMNMYRVTKEDWHSVPRQQERHRQFHSSAVCTNHHVHAHLQMLSCVLTRKLVDLATLQLPLSKLSTGCFTTAQNLRITIGTNVRVA